MQRHKMYTVKCSALSTIFLKTGKITLCFLLFKKYFFSHFFFNILRVLYIAGFNVIIQNLLMKAGHTKFEPEWHFEL